MERAARLAVLSMADVPAAAAQSPQMGRHRKAVPWMGQVAAEAEAALVVAAVEAAVDPAVRLGQVESAA
jgi:hypothetical protein